MNETTRMTALLAAFRRERNGAVADAMRPFGVSCGLNYGVSLPTVRSIARNETPNHSFARYLWMQDVRELRLSALHLAEPARISPEEFSFWGAGIVNDELAEEAAFALLYRIELFPKLFEDWLSGDEPLLRYAALMAAARFREPSPAWVETAAEVLHLTAVEAVKGSVERLGTDASGSDATLCASGIGDKAEHLRVGCTPAQAAHLMAQGVVALMVAIGTRNEENRQAVIRAAGSLGKLPAEDFVHEELAWRL